MIRYASVHLTSPYIVLYSLVLSYALVLGQNPWASLISSSLPKLQISRKPLEFQKLPSGDLQIVYLGAAVARVLRPPGNQTRVSEGLSKGHFPILINLSGVGVG